MDYFTPMALTCSVLVHFSLDLRLFEYIPIFPGFSIILSPILSPGHNCFPVPEFWLHMDPQTMSSQQVQVAGSELQSQMNLS
jgi:hypothetical protein